MLRLACLICVAGSLISVAGGVSAGLQDSLEDKQDFKIHALGCLSELFCGWSVCFVLRPACLMFVARGRFDLSCGWPV